MSVSKLPGTRGYLVRWRDSAGASRSKTVLRQRDAFALDGEMKRKKAMGELITHEMGGETLADFWDLFWANYAQVRLSERSRESYEVLWRKHIAPKFGWRKLRTINHEQVALFVTELSKDRSPATVAKVHAVLRSVLQRAVEWQRIPTNAAAGVRKPRVESRPGRALTATELDALCVELSSLRSRVIARTLAWTGMRPGELRGLRWHDLWGNTLLVERSVSKDVVGPTKTATKRGVELTPASRKLLVEWYMASGRPSSGAMMFPGSNGVWTDVGYNIWAKRVFAPAASRAGLKGVRPYDLRHTFVSTHVAAGRDIYWIARQTGHSPEVMLRTYTHLLGGETVAFECPANWSIDGKSEPTPGIEPGTPSLRGNSQLD